MVNDYEIFFPIGALVALPLVVVSAAAVRVTYNRPPHRAVVFGAGLIVVTTIWARFLLLLGDTTAAV